MPLRQSSTFGARDNVAFPTQTAALADPNVGGLPPYPIHYSEAAMLHPRFRTSNSLAGSYYQ